MGQAVAKDSYVRIPPTKIMESTLMLRDRTILSLCYGALLVLVAGNLHAEIYRWVDDEGVVNFTQRKPSNVEVDIIGKPANTRPPQTYAEPVTPSVAQSDQQENRLKLTAEQREMYAALQEKEADRQAQISKISTSNCKRSKALLQRLSTSGRINIRAADGNERILPDEERAQRIAEIQRGIVVNCASS